MEAQFGTDPLNPDTDGDGFTDGYEATVGSNPVDPASQPPAPAVMKSGSTLADADKDGLPDLYEEEIGTDKYAADSDGDGASDSIEALINRAPLTPEYDVELDSDGDGLPDSFEKQVGTNSAASDTDRDGLSDAAELLYGTDPLNPDSNKNGLIDGADASDRTFTFVPKGFHFGD